VVGKKRALLVLRDISEYKKDRFDELLKFLP
jgi:DNA-binding HxlR family transcriptional regulator